MSDDARYSMTSGCSECREALAANPSTDKVRDHLEHCGDCRAWRAELLALDARIAQALAVPVPPLEIPDFADEPAANDLPRGPRYRLPVAGWLALAASVLVAVTFGVRYAGDDVPAQSLGEQVLAHIDHESFSLTVSDRAVGEERLARIVPANIARLGPETGLVTYAQSCIINGRPVPHLVVQGQHGPVTILLMPHEKIDGPERIANEQLEGVLLPVGDGSIAIVGEDAQDIEGLEESVKNSVTWRT